MPITEDSDMMPKSTTDSAITSVDAKTTAIPKVSSTSSTNNIIFRKDDPTVDEFTISYTLCEENYRGCLASIRECQRSYQTCKSLPPSSSGDLEEEVVSKKDPSLEEDLLQCQTRYFSCRSNSANSCQLTGEKCVSQALERARQKAILVEQEPPESRASDEQTENVIGPIDIEKFNVALSDNFTTCVTKYSRCLDYRGDQVYCTDQFHMCSLGILDDANISDKTIQTYVYDPSKNEGLEDHELSEDLFICIQNYMMCQDKSGQGCMRDYNECTLKVLDAYHSDQLDSQNEIGRESSEEEGLLPVESTDACNGLNVPKTYGSFSGRQASNTGMYHWL